MASLYEFNGSDGDATGTFKVCKSTKMTQPLVADWLPVPNKIMILYLSEGAVAMSLEGEVLLNTMNRKQAVNSRVPHSANC